MSRSYNIDSISYLRRARRRLDEGTHEGLFYAAFELRCGTESRLRDYLDSRDDIAKRKKQGWRIMGSAKELDRILRLGDTVFEACFLDEQGERDFALYYTPITARLREAAGGRLGEILHAMKISFDDDNSWWSGTRSFLEQLYSDLASANRGTLLAPLMRSPDGKMHTAISGRDDPSIAAKLELWGKLNKTLSVKVYYHKSLPDYAEPFLHRTDA